MATSEQENEVTQYVTEIKNRLNIILNRIGESFITYYGEEYREKIEYLISRLIVVLYYDNNISHSHYEKDKAKTRFGKIKEKIHDKVQNSNGRYSILESNKEIDKNLSREISSILENVEKGERGQFWPNLSISTISLLFDGKIRLGSYIHEISHYIQTVLMAQIVTDNDIFQDDIKQIGIFYVGESEQLNEIINEEIVRDVLNIYIEKYGLEEDILDYSFGGGYTQIDGLLNQTGNKIYELLKEEIKYHAINGTILTIRKILGKAVIKEYDRLFNIVYSDILNSKEKSLKNYKSQREPFLEELKPSEQRIINTVLQNYENYLEYNKKIKQYVSSLNDDDVVKRSS